MMKRRIHHARAGAEPSQSCEDWLRFTGNMGEPPARPYNHSRNWEILA